MIMLKNNIYNIDKEFEVGTKRRRKDRSSWNKIFFNYEEKEPIFWHVFEELSNDNNGLVDYDKLQERLISTERFYAGEAVLMIEHMVKIGKIE
jgi:hypothetical protein